jgi:hypothetical protein
MGAVRANFRDWLASDRSKLAKIARKSDCSAWHPSFHTVWLIYARALTEQDERAKTETSES